MRIGIDARFYGSLGKGLGRYTEKLVKYLEELDHDNEYIVFLRKENFDEYQPSQRNFVKVLADYRWYSFEEQIRFPRLLGRYCLDLMHFPHFNVPLLYRGKFVVTIHDLILLHFPTRRATTLHPLWYAVKFMAYKMVIGRAVRRAESIVTVSEYTRRDISYWYSKASKKMTVTYEAAEPFCYHHDRGYEEQFLQSLGLMSKEKKDTLGHGKYGIIQPYLLYVGNAYPHKNLETFLVAAKKLEQEGAEAILVGKEDYFYRRLKQFADVHGIRNVRFVGFVSDTDLDILYRYATAYVFPSLYEGFGLPPLEAMNKGVPVVAAKATSLPEILGNAALYFDPKKEYSLEEALKKIWEDEALRLALRQKGYIRSAMFEWVNMARETLRVYQEAVAQKNNRK